MDAGEKVIRFPGSQGEAEDTQRERQVSESGRNSTGIVNMTVDQEKALKIAADGMSFVMVGIRPTDSGADFFTAVHGAQGELADAAPHLGGVLHRALVRAGVLPEQ